MNDSRSSCINLQSVGRGPRPEHQSATVCQLTGAVCMSQEVAACSFLPLRRHNSGSSVSSPHLCRYHHQPLRCSLTPDTPPPLHPRVCCTYISTTLKQFHICLDASLPPSPGSETGCYGNMQQSRSITSATPPPPSSLHSTANN